MIKLRSWEYWPFAVVYTPIIFYWLWLSLKARSFFFFSASNPGIKNGGMLGESKIQIFDLIPEKYTPKTCCIIPNDIDSLLKSFKANRYEFPVICKPDIGERGWQVKKITSESELVNYAKNSSVNFLIQEYIDLPIEAGVFYQRHPDKSKGKVTSVVLKEMLYVIGDGVSTLQELILNNNRSKLQWAKLVNHYSEDLKTILPLGQKKELISIGNHCLGTKFIDGNYLINQQMNRAFDEISKQINGFYYGRFDLRVADFQDLYTGDIKIMELNGAGSEPSHIYDPSFSLWNAYKVLFSHWSNLYKISIANKKRGVNFLSFNEGWEEYKKVRAMPKF